MTKKMPGRAFSSSAFSKTVQKFMTLLIFLKSETKLFTRVGDIQKGSLHTNDN